MDTTLDHSDRLTASKCFKMEKDSQKVRIPERGIQVPCCSGDWKGKARRELGILLNNHNAGHHQAGMLSEKPSLNFLQTRTGALNVPFRHRLRETNTFCDLVFFEEADMKRELMHREASMPALPVSFSLDEFGRKVILPSSASPSERPKSNRGGASAAEKKNDPGASNDLTSTASSSFSCYSCRAPGVKGCSDEASSFSSSSSPFVAALPSVGSVRHKSKGRCTCFPCVFAGKGCCMRGWICERCHYCGVENGLPNLQRQRLLKELVRMQRLGVNNRKRANSGKQCNNDLKQQPRLNLPDLDKARNFRDSDTTLAVSGKDGSGWG
uniref:Uncharacterized protein n=1 Tax=Chromera velia CCMP2878 TaxID=1169474 RepID=A0A0G4F9N9_9ALVE|eukprot:Cvel_15930.t1-p1 / transcript=Cvel_15930.t1 / gene=Cvel_15930 / organism=Chromera_velia_CCMP2878 / gene_product=hypothetical protein / transcript_product=hypothetical protein / location=Cvel_scaffold1205:1420-4811(-) / protein_length=324 / sequence_SO=supercontig / SO=protein_coding / is_pseudo=false